MVTKKSAILAFSFVALFVLACATLPPAKPIRDFRDIAGKWEGTIETFYKGQTIISPIVLITRKDGTGESFVPKGSPHFPYSDQGKFHFTQELIAGKIRIANTRTGETGIRTLHEGGGKRVLIYKADDGLTRAVLEPAQE
jgi:hypothetical protein